MFIIKEGKPSNNGLFQGLMDAENGHFFVNGLVISFILPRTIPYNNLPILPPNLDIENNVKEQKRIAQTPPPVILIFVFLIISSKIF